MPIVPNLLERVLLGRLNLLPGILLDYGATLGFRAAIAASRIGVFDALASGPRSVTDVAAATSSNEDALEQLLVALAALGYVRRDRGRWSLTPLSQRWLVAGSRDSIVDGLAFLERNAFEIWDGLEGVLKSGRPRTSLYEALEASPELSSSFQAWDRVAGRLVGDPIIRAMPIPRGARRLLDLGGGNGIYSVLLCRRYPQLAATIVDLPVALRSAQGPIGEAGLEGRVSLRPGDFFEVDLGGGYDVVLLANIVHGLSDDDALRLVRRAGAALRPGGTIIVVDQAPGDAGGPATQAITALLGLSYVVSLGGRTWSPDTIAEWMRMAGFGAIRTTRPRRAPGNVIVAGVRAA